MYAVRAIVLFAETQEKYFLLYTTNHKDWSEKVFRNTLKNFRNDIRFCAWRITHFKNGIPQKMKSCCLVNGLDGEPLPLEDVFANFYFGAGRHKVLSKFRHFDVDRVLFVHLQTNHSIWASDFNKDQKKWFEETEGIYAYNLSLSLEGRTGQKSAINEEYCEFEKETPDELLYHSLTEALKIEMN